MPPGGLSGQISSIRRSRETTSFACTSRIASNARCFRTLEASTGSAGISDAAEHLPDVILMDIRLPDMDGTDALRRLRTTEATASIPILALTSLAMKGDRERLLAAGFDGYLEKPIDIREFPDQVRRYCRPEEA